MNTGKSNQLGGMVWVHCTTLYYHVIIMRTSCLCTYFDAQMKLAKLHKIHCFAMFILVDPGMPLTQSTNDPNCFLDFMQFFMLVSHDCVFTDSGYKITKRTGLLLTKYNFSFYCSDPWLGHESLMCFRFPTNHGDEFNAVIFLDGACRTESDVSHVETALVLNLRR